MGAGHVEAEGHGSFHQPADVGVGAQQVLDELAPQRLLPPHHLPARVVVPVRQVRDGLVDHMQHRRGCATDDLAVPGPDDSG